MHIIQRCSPTETMLVLSLYLAEFVSLMETYESDMIISILLIKSMWI